MTVPLVEFEDVTARGSVAWRLDADLQSVSLTIDEGDFVGVLGEARTGKSSLLRLAAGIQAPESGAVRFRGRDLAALTDRERALLLRRSVGLAPSAVDMQAWGRWRGVPVLDHVGAALISDGASARGAVASAREALDRVGAASCTGAATHELTLIERTRVAIAVALVREPDILLVDEPAASQSPAGRDDIRDLLDGLHDERGFAVVMASENLGVLRSCRRLVSIGGGALVSSDRAGEVVPFVATRGTRRR